MLTTIVCFINGYIILLGGRGFIKDYDMAFCCALLELIITIGVLGIISVLKGDK